MVRTIDIGTEFSIAPHRKMYAWLVQNIATARQRVKLTDSDHMFTISRINIKKKIVLKNFPRVQKFKILHVL